MFCVNKHKHENPKSKHETNSKKQTVKIGNLHVLVLDLLSNVLCTIISPLSSRLSSIHIDTLMLVSSNSISCYILINVIIKARKIVIKYDNYIYEIIAIIVIVIVTKKVKTITTSYNYE